MSNYEYIKNKIIELGIPLHNRNGKSTVDLILLGYREANWSAQGASNFTKKWFPNKPTNTSILKYLLSLEQKKFCPSCKNIVYLSEFHNNLSKKDGKATSCKNCKKEIQDKYYKENKSVFIEHNIKYRYSIEQATPKWADKELIKKIYANCPKGCHVDHYYPLHGDIVCGLHVPENLQYLTAEENLVKSNKMPDKPIIPICP
jgi:hypothetical protein